MKDKNHEQLATKIMMNALEGVKAQIRKAYDKGYKDGKADTPFTDTEEAEEKAYNRGLNEAWKAAKKIAGDMTDGGYSLDELHEIFNETLNRIIFKRNTASEAIAKIKEYEDKRNNHKEIMDFCETMGYSFDELAEVLAEMQGMNGSIPGR